MLETFSAPIVASYEELTECLLALSKDLKTNSITADQFHFRWDTVISSNTTIMEEKHAQMALSAMHVEEIVAMEQVAVAFA